MGLSVYDINKKFLQTGGRGNARHMESLAWLYKVQ